MRNRFRAGDTTALGEAYDEHAQVLFRYAMRVCGDQAAAEDVVSATFLEAWRCRERLRPDGDGLRPWLLGIATNILRSTAREARRRDTALARLADRGVLPDFADDVVTRLYDTEQLTAARAALKRLRRRDREVFALVVWAGLDYAAAGEALDIPIGTVRSRLSRARDRLRTLAEAELKAVRKARRGGGVGGSAGPRTGSGRAALADAGPARTASADAGLARTESAGAGPARTASADAGSPWAVRADAGPVRTASADARPARTAPADAHPAHPARPTQAVAATAPVTPAAAPSARTTIPRVPVATHASAPVPAPALARRSAPENSL
ncbi:sigma-70 family RNA polymerase sigma factor [Streptomyces sp. NPDC046374]|uniref:sigma-70 family RNA polymerase sigma factor n=1 Tax=Streptomyces sp. NPDC046374 TaxID=3154917 RepID=UPI00340C12D4